MDHDLHVIEDRSFAFLIEAQHDDACLDPLDHLDAVLPVEAFGVLDRHGVDHVDIARDQRGDCGRGILDRCQGCTGDVVLRRAPPAVEGHERRLEARLAVLHHEGAGAVCVERGVVALVLVGPLVMMSMV